MFDFDAGKLLIIAVVALVVIGPKDLPRVLRQVGQMVARVRRMAAEFQGQFMDAMKEADLEGIRKDVAAIRDGSGLTTAFDPARDIQRELTAALDAPASAAAVPALVETDAVPTGGFALPAPETAPMVLMTGPGLDDAEPVTTLAAGIAPVAEGLPGESGSGEPPPMAASSKKRKIRMRKRLGVSPRRPHVVSDRTAPPRVLPLLRRQDAAGR